MNTIAIKTEKLAKQYRIGGSKPGFRTLGETIASTLSTRFRTGRKNLTLSTNEMFWALNNVSIEFHRGEITAIIGRNGSGKTTLLKILAGITAPTRGHAELYGRPGALLEIGTGFHKEMTGRENVYLNGAILGMKRREIDRKFDQIVDFAEVERFIDTPVKFYSSGMYLRLAFSVAAHLEPEILLVDEVLAVGDSEFQKKCINRMATVTKQGKTVLFVSHNLAAVQTLCTRGIVLDSGSVVQSGPVTEALRAYSHLLRQSGDISNTADTIIRLSDVSVCNRAKSIHAGEPLTITFSLWVMKDVLRNSIRLTLRSPDDQIIVYAAPETDLGVQMTGPGIYQITIQLPALWLKPGLYDVRIKAVAEVLGEEKIRVISDPQTIHFSRPGLKQIELPGFLIPESQWEVRREELSSRSNTSV